MHLLPRDRRSKPSGFMVGTSHRCMLCTMRLARGSVLQQQGHSNGPMCVLCMGLAARQLQKQLQQLQADAPGRVDCMAQLLAPWLCAPQPAAGSSHR